MATCNGFGKFQTFRGAPHWALKLCTHPLGNESGIPMITARRVF
ncbi:hypothetical protein FGSG_12019 [Fusarium graminearum PH-1]|uniref:Chromosome 1, complete genome n=1 Tax=Gibberella zeae (strain ATCC MYA-4620 / CBS 123657 / FGSC 9075 / NRRL 31084 / PH-1) TaxID=229533 RepID=I1S5A1_GIBZE|nr:hypothetical protein FGSG_12019 [Fusarium graminearum PH-1]ESU07196.1 hypothetical protein FGSG_12019 [Fusarium graminearum PH-1]CEF74029.1 unnamed protein product [Fusarium graminearum]|eukprot:XP_011317681.1 hypothetical protein FGSG_12019 [Fusarium graminearum PH-1]